MKIVGILLVCIYALTAEGGAPTFSETFNATVSVFTAMLADSSGACAAINYAACMYMLA